MKLYVHAYKVAKKLIRGVTGIRCTCIRVYSNSCRLAAELDRV